MKSRTLSQLLSLAGISKPRTEYRRPDGSKWLMVTNSADMDRAEMVIEGSIGENPYEESTSSTQFRKALNEIHPQKQVLVRIHSPGGSVGDALAIHNLIKERGNVDTHVDGYALSSASLIVQGGRNRTMPHSALMMIHNPHSMTYGDSEEHRKSLEMLKKHEDTMAEMYAEASGKTMEECKALMEAESWFTGAEAAEHGFVDEVNEDKENDMNTTANALAGVDLSKFAKVPAHVLAMARPISASLPAGGPAGTAASVDPNQTMNTPTPTAAATPPANPNTSPAAAPPAAPQLPAGSVIIDKAELDAIKAGMAEEKKRRIEAKIDSLIDSAQLSNDERDDALTRALADEKYLDVIAKRPSLFQAGSPLGPQPHELTVTGNAFDRIRDLRATGSGHPVGGLEAVSAQMRYDFRRQNWNEIYTQAKLLDQRGRPNRSIVSNPNVRFCQAGMGPDGVGRMLPQAASSYAASLVVDQLADGAITQLVNTLAPLRVFVRDFAPSPFMPLATVQVRLVTQGGGLTKTGKLTGTPSATAIDYESGDHAVTNVPITMFEYSEAFFCDSQELMSGLRIEYLANHALETLGSNIISDTLVLLNDKTFTAGPSGGTLTAHYGTWTWNSGSATTDMAAARYQLGKSGIKNAVLDPVLFSKLITIPVSNQMQVGMPMRSANVMANIMGWDEIVETTAWGTGQGASGSTASFPQPVIGFICHPQAIAAAARLPLLPPEGVPGNTVTMATVAIPGIDLSVAIFSWFSVRYRTLWNSYGIVYGAKQGDLTAGCVIQSLGI